MLDSAVLVLAAGNGIQMKSGKPAALCEVLFRPVISWVLEAVKNAGYPEEAVCVVCGEDGGALEQVLPAGIHTVRQEQDSGHVAVLAAQFLRSLAPGAQVLVLPGDTPFISPELIGQSREAHREAGANLTVITAEQQQRVREISSGAMWADAQWLLSVLPRLSCENPRGIHSLSDAAALAAADGVKSIVYTAPDSDAVLSVGSQKELLTLNRLAAQRVLEKHMENGVEVLSADGVLIGPEVTIGPGTVIYPGTILKGNTMIGAGCVLGPNTVIQNSTVGDGCTVNSSQIEDSVLESGVSMGPFAHIRPGSHIGNGVHLGNFTEVKNSSIGDRTAVSHLTYVGDSDVGVAVNFGCGCVTVNYDGQKKHRTTIGDHAFIGCNTNLVAPVTVGDFGYTAAGSTITQDVPEKSLAIERGKQYNKEGWAEGKIKIK